MAGEMGIELCECSGCLGRLWEYTWIPCGEGHTNIYIIPGSQIADRERQEGQTKGYSERVAG